MKLAEKDIAQEEFLRILGKGMVTIPKSWRKQLRLEEGSMVRARKEGQSVVLEPMTKSAPYRVYTKKELQEFLEQDKV